MKKISAEQQARDDAYENGGFIPRAEAYPPRWEAEAAAFREATPSALDQPYGEHPRQRYDLFPGQGRGIFIFVHGGYWKARAKFDWSHFAAGMLAQGFDVALLGYRLAPEVRVREITADIAAGVQAVAAARGGEIVLAGHSAGGHLVARMAQPGVLPDGLATRLARVMPISPLSDLRPFLDLSMNEVLNLDPSEAEAESPALGPVLPNVKVNVVVGSQERPAFLDQTRWLSEAWGCPQTILPARHHFGVIDPLLDEGSAMCRWLAED